MRIVAPWGFYGVGNTGDEGTLCGFARLLALTGIRADVAIASVNARHTARVEPTFRYFKNPGGLRGIDPRRWWAMARGTVHAVIGGTPVMDVLGDWPLSVVAPVVRASERQGVPFIFVGCGIESLRSEQSRRIVSDELAPRVHHWSVRSSRDRARLIENGVAPEAVTAAADMAWLVEPSRATWAKGRLKHWGVETDRPLVAVSVVNENSCFDRQPQFGAALAASLDTFIEKYDARVVFLCAEIREGPTFDKAAATHVIGRMKRASQAVLIPNDYLSPQELMSIISCCTFTVSMRYHVCLFSALQGVPFVAIERADKVADLCWDLDWSGRVVPPHFEAAELIAHGQRLVEDTRLTDRLMERVRVLKDRALLNSTPFAALSKPEGM
jgi:polysaccharide pyruvyl transferase WcaK-like protein